MQVEDPMLMSDEEVARELTARLVAEFHPSRIIWFGSRARGAPRPDSDFDLLVVARTELSLGERLLRAQQVVRDIPVATDILVLTPEEHARYSTWKSSVVYDANQTGRVLFEAQV